MTGTAWASLATAAVALIGAVAAWINSQAAHTRVSDHLQQVNSTPPKAPPPG